MFGSRTPWKKKMKQEELDDLLEACCFYEVGEQNEKKEVFKDG